MPKNSLHFNALWQLLQFVKNPTAEFGLMQAFLARLHVREMLVTSPLPQSLSNRGSSPVVMGESVLMAVWVGGVHVAHAALVRFDAVLYKIFA